MNNFIQQRLSDSIAIKQALYNDSELINEISSQAAIMTNVLKSGGKIWFCGNGGSAADAQHIAAELSGRFYLDRKALSAEALHVNSSFVTAVGNDYGFEQIYARAIESQGRPGDILIAISTSGNSANIIHAVHKAKEIGLYTIGWTGQDGGKLKEICDSVLKIPSSDTPRIQECHIFVGHLICEWIENVLFKAEIK